MLRPALLTSTLSRRKGRKSENRGEAGEARNAANAHDVFSASTSASCTYAWMIIERREEGEIVVVVVVVVVTVVVVVVVVVVLVVVEVEVEEEEVRKKRNCSAGWYAKETVGNRASRNADADKGNPYDRF